MGLRSWFTFTRTAREAHALADHLIDQASHEEDVYGVHFIALLDQPFEGDKKFAIAWSSDGSTAVQEAKQHVMDTRLLDNMGKKWQGDPEKYSRLLHQDELRGMADSEGRS